MKLAVEVNVPATVCISTELLAELTSPAQVVKLLTEGQIARGQRVSRNRRGRGRRKISAVSDADVRAAREEAARQAALLEDEIQGAL